MASVKTSVDNLDQQKREYEKAIKSLNNALEQIKKVNRSLGKDNMLEGARTALTKLSASLETRAEVLLHMTKALEQSGEKYTAAQKKAVAKSNQFNAHNRDFYGNPVVVTAANVVVSVSGADSNISITAPNTENVSVQIDSEIRPGTYMENSSVTDVSQTNAHAGNTAISEAAGASVSVSVSTESGSVTDIPQTNAHVGNTAIPEADGASASESIPTESGSGAGISQAIANAGNTAAPEATVTSASELIEKPLSAETGAVTNAVNKGASNSEAIVFAAGAAAGAVVGGIAGAAMGSLGKSGQKDKDQESDIEAQLEAARERLRQLNEEMDVPTSADET